RQLLQRGGKSYVTTVTNVVEVGVGSTNVWDSPKRSKLNQLAVDSDGTVYAASAAGLFRRSQQDWERIEMVDEVGRDWGAGEVRGVAFDSKDRLWVGTRAGAGFREGGKWRFYEGKDGL